MIEEEREKKLKSVFKIWTYMFKKNHINLFQGQSMLKLFMNKTIFFNIITVMGSSAFVTLFNLQNHFFIVFDFGITVLNLVKYDQILGRKRFFHKQTNKTVWNTIISRPTLQLNF